MRCHDGDGAAGGGGGGAARASSGTSASVVRPRQYAGQPLTSMVVEDGVAVIGREAFQGCVRLLLLQLPASVRAIEARALHGCVALRSVKLDAAGLAEVGSNVFACCPGHLSIHLGQ